ncbi:SufE family protein [Rubinisphaera sp. JC750]|uniref:SufE family protein n=1 Tax=Rubinisphaera sp. JC750 TaxID=2898658 RepID=UPI001F3F1B88|nr:SufE family protein [Rubinisphaera sp. JC750]
MIDRIRQNETPPLTLQDIIDEFEFLGDREAQIDYLIDLGLELPPLEEEFKTEQFRVHGCQSNVWMTTDFDENDRRLHLRAESDAMIVSGLIAVLVACYDGKPPQEVLDLDIRDVFSRLGIDRHISPQRKNGLNGMIQRILGAAQAELEAGA